MRDVIGAGRSGGHRDVITARRGWVTGCAATRRGRLSRGGGAARPSEHPRSRTLLRDVIALRRSRVDRGEGCCEELEECLFGG